MADAVTNAFIGKKEEPTDAELGEALGSTKSVWDELIAWLAGEHDVTIREWTSYSPKFGWSLRLKRGKRTIVWLAPCAGCFQAAYILGEKAMLAARQCGLSAKAVRLLDEAKKYPEGTGVRLLIKGPRDIPAVKKLAAVKVAN